MRSGMRSGPKTAVTDAGCPRVRRRST
jgi:hypothetical protein